MIQILTTFFFVFISVQLCAAKKIELSDKEQAWLNQHRIVRARVGTVPPLHFFDGQYKGISVEYLNQIAKRVGFQVKYVTDIPWPNALENIKNHKVIDLLLTAKITPERRQIIAFTNDYLLMPYVIFSQKDHYYISTIKDLNQKTVSVEEGYAIYDKLVYEYPKIKLLKKKSSIDAIRAVSLGEADAYIGNLTIATYIIQRYNLTNLKVAAPTPFDNHNQAMAIRNDWPELASIIDKSLDAMIPKEHETIRNRWLSIRYEYGIQIIDVLKWILTVVLPLVIFLIVILFWNRRLKSEITNRERIEAKLKESESLRRAWLEHSPDCTKILDLDFNLQYMSGAGVRGLRIDDITSYYGKPYPFEFYPESFKKPMRENLAKAKEIGETITQEAPVVDVEGNEIWFHSTIMPINDDKGLLDYIMVVSIDTTERKAVELKIKASLKEKEILLHEIHHRVKNNMQVINSLLRLQSSNIEDERIKSILKDSQSRVYAMSAVHETLHGSEKLSEINLKSYLSKITTSIFQTYSTDHRKVKLNSKVEDSPISINQAYPLGLIINELISNSLKYAFPDEKEGEVNVNMKVLDKDIQLTVMDNGSGMPENVDWKNSKTLGLKLVRTLVENQLDGSIDMESNNGTKFTIKFNIDKAHA